MEGVHEPLAPIRRLITAAFKVRLGAYEYYDLGRMDVVCRLCRALCWKKEKISGSVAENYRFESCCKKGDIERELLKQIPKY